MVVAIEPFLEPEAGLGTGSEVVEIDALVGVSFYDMSRARPATEARIPVPRPLIPRPGPPGGGVGYEEQSEAHGETY